MSYTDPHSVNVQPESTSRASVAALVLGLLSLPGSLLAWDTLPGGGFVWGLPLAVAAVVVGVGAVERRHRSRARDLRSRPRRRHDRHDGDLDRRRSRLKSLASKSRAGGRASGDSVGPAAALALAGCSWTVLSLRGSTGVRTEAGADVGATVTNLR